MSCQVSFERFLGVWVIPEAIKHDVIWDCAQTPHPEGAVSGGCARVGEHREMQLAVYSTPLPSKASMKCYLQRFPRDFFRWNNCKLREIGVIKLFSALGFRA